MRYRVLATDYDGTVAHHGTVAEETFESLRAVKQSNRAVILVTGRELADLQRVCPSLDVFDRIVVENGATIYNPATRVERALAEPPPQALIDALKQRGVSPLSVGKVIVATWEPHERTVLDTIRELGLELQVIFNKGAVMVLPSGVNKASGLHAALAELCFSTHNTVGVGDAENDHALLAMCACAVATQNAVPLLKERADLTTQGRNGEGVRELIAGLLADDLASVEPRLARHRIPIGEIDTPGSDDKTPVTIRPYGETILFAGKSGSGKSTLTTAMLEQLAERKYQFVLIDPEGDYSDLDHAVTIGDAHRPPSIDEVMKLLDPPEQNVNVNLVAASLSDRQAFTFALIPRLWELRTRVGRPHWIVLDEAHHLMPGPEHGTSTELPRLRGSVLMVTVEPDHLAAGAIEAVQTCVTVGPAAQETLRTFCEARGVATPTVDDAHLLERGRAIVWKVGEREPARVFRTLKPRTEQRRHRRKYAEGDLGPERSFYFIGPEGKLKLRAQNFLTFVQMAEGVDEETWLFHLRRHDYSGWIRESLKDTDLADKVARVEARPDLDAKASLSEIKALIDERYTAPA